MWRPIKREDVRRGLAVNPFGKTDNSPFSVGTIIMLSGMGDEWSQRVTIARPIAYASETSNQKHSLVSIDVIEIKMEDLLERALVWEDSDTGQPRTLTVK